MTQPRDPEHHDPDVRGSEHRYGWYCNCGQHRDGFTSHREAEQDASEHVRQA